MEHEKEKKLMIKLVDRLKTALDGFMEDENPGEMTNEIFKVVHIASIVHCCYTIAVLSSIVKSKEDKIRFLENSKEAFFTYLNGIEDE